MRSSKPCPDCDSTIGVSRREFLAATTAGVALASIAPVTMAAETPKGEPEALVKSLFGKLSDAQRKQICFDWDHTEQERGLLRTRISNNWQITKQTINSPFFNDEQREILREIWKGLIRPEWQARVEKQLQDDNNGKPWGTNQSIAIFGKPGEGDFELVMTGRHMTLRCDGNSTPHMAFGGPIFYGHAASGFNEKPGHPGNVYWEQALAANKVFEMLDGKQREKALVASNPIEEVVSFKGPQGKFDGIAISDLSSDQKEQVQKTLAKLIEPYRQADQSEVTACLQAQGGLDRCSLAFYSEDDLGKDRVWDNWRLEGPSFVWYFRGFPHVHVWVNVADTPDVKTNS